MSKWFDSSARHNQAMWTGTEVQRDPYTHLMSESEKQWARNLVPRAIFTGAGMAATAVYYLSRHNQMGRVRGLKITFDMIFSVGLRVALAGLVGEQITRRLFVNYYEMKKHQMAEYEVKKIMRTWPDPLPMAEAHKKPNSYLWV